MVGRLERLVLLSSVFVTGQFCSGKCCTLHARWFWFHWVPLALVESCASPPFLTLWIWCKRNSFYLCWRCLWPSVRNHLTLVIESWSEFESFDIRVIKVANNQAHIYRDILCWAPLGFRTSWLCRVKHHSLSEKNAGSSRFWSGQTIYKKPKLSGLVASFWNLVSFEMNTNSGGWRKTVNATVFKLAVGVSDIVGTVFTWYRLYLKNALPVLECWSFIKSTIFFSIISPLRTHHSISIIFLSHPKVEIDHSWYLASIFYLSFLYCFNFQKLFSHVFPTSLQFYLWSLSWDWGLQNQH